jgi:hypothetical protein
VSGPTLVSVIVFPPRKSLVVWRAVTAAAVLVRERELIVMIDRASVDVDIETMPGVPHSHPDTTKLMVSADRLVLATIGKAVVPVPGGGSLDLPAIAFAAADGERTARRAAAAIAEAFEPIASTVLGHAGRGAFPAAPFIEPLLTAVVVAGPSPMGVQAFVVGLTARATCVVEQLEGSMSYAPEADAHDLEVAVLNAAAATSTDDAIAMLAASIRHAATKTPAFVSLDVDYAIVRPGTVASVERLVHESRPYPFGA